MKTMCGDGFCVTACVDQTFQHISVDVPLGDSPDTLSIVTIKKSVHQANSKCTL